MTLCNHNCQPCCDFCIHAIHDKFIYPDGSDIIIGGPIGCLLHHDDEHQTIAKNCGFCDDFHCINAKE